MQVCNADDLGISQPSVSHKPNHQRALLEELTELSSKLVKAEIIPLISSNSLFGFLWTINNYTGSKPTSWQLQVCRVWSVLLTGRTYKSLRHQKMRTCSSIDSINTQIAFDATFNILDVAKWPAGSTRDPRILMGSGLRREAPCTSWWLSLQDVLTPYLSPQPGAQLKYNMQVITQISPMRKKHRISSLSPFIC
ncbi:hypothetical protein N1851_020306 [Merluccius polli]|uniref:Uncharacterized protein n=1 Tax=Merluccius polli TaxID=89951 RepID=A0AA47MKX4_MERPO|nr:hypothetical protein N1851_020306 [Merluccius polli]